MGDNVYNLGFGDFRLGRIDDKAISGNKDLVKMMNTVAKTIYLFTERYPERKVYIRAVDAKRSRFYPSIFEKKVVEIESNFVIKGLTEENWEPYKPSIIFKAFLLERKR